MAKYCEICNKGVVSAAVEQPTRSSANTMSVCSGFTLNDETYLPVFTGG